MLGNQTIQFLPLVLQTIDAFHEWLGGVLLVLRKDLTAIHAETSGLD